MRPAFALISTILTVVSGPSYVKDILQGKAKPERSTFLIFTLLSAIAFYGQLQLGAGLSLIFTGLDVLGSFGVFLLSLKYGVSGFGKQEKFAMIVALIGLVISLVAHAPLLAILGVMLADIAAMYLTLRKTFLNPDTEPYISWILFGLAAVFSGLSVQHYSFGLVVYPAYIALAAFAIPATKYFGYKRLTP